MRQLTAHELLNAAGRAGRAGSMAQGIVLIIPGKVIAFDAEKLAITDRFNDLQRIFSQSDQCLQIDDPIEQWLDMLAHYSESPQVDENERYFLNRLPIGENDEAASQFLRRSLSAFRARATGKTEEYERKLAHSLGLRRAFQADRPLDWRDALSASTGFSLEIINELSISLSALTPTFPASVPDWVNWWFDWVKEVTERATHLFGSRLLSLTLPKLFKSLGAQITDDEVELLKTLHSLVLAWMQGESLKQLELRCGTNARKLETCKNARELVLRVVPTVSYAISLIPQVHLAHSRVIDPTARLSSLLESLPGCVREGVNSPEQLALYYVMKEEGSRLRAQTLHMQIAERLPPSAEGEGFRDTMVRMGAAYRTLTVS